MRQIEVPLKIRLDRLHEVVQAAMGWSDTHLYEFRAGGAGWGVPDPDGFCDGPMPATKATLQKVLEDTGARTIQYIYDFGDDWDHSIRIERVTEATPGVTYPRLLKASGACPPEDVGGPPATTSSSRPSQIRTKSSTTIWSVGQVHPWIPKMPASTGSSNALTSSQRNGRPGLASPKHPRPLPEHGHPSAAYAGWLQTTNGLAQINTQNLDVHQMLLSPPMPAMIAAGWWEGSSSH